MQASGLSQIVLVFESFVVLHILAGSLGLVSFWIPVTSRKGSLLHRQWGRIFTWSMLITGTAAIGISLSTLVDPLNTHPHLQDAEWIRGIFGWMMLGLAVLTLNLAWYGHCCLANKTDHRRNLEWRNVTLQVLLFVASINCAWQALRIGQPIMLGMPAIGLATVASNLAFMLKREPASIDWLKEHIKALVGAGISVYTAFFAFGAVRTIPTLALHPGLWSIPLIIGLALIIYYRLQVERQAKEMTARPSGS
ncbi:MAG: hypothetical protein ACO32H_08200 [Steroidobacteraceae bacterium]